MFLYLKIYLNFIPFILRHRYGEANNKDLDYDPSKPSSYITYLDANNLYGWAMSAPLPYDNFNWVDHPEEIPIEQLDSDGDVGYILEVDVEYPYSIHKKPEQLPYLPVTKCPPNGKHEKLLCHLEGRHRYVVHYRNLQQAIRNGLVVVKVHRALQFSQSKWLKPYIDFNTELRTNAKNDFEKDQFKLYNNSVFGKTMENIRNRINIELVCDWKRAKKLIAKPNFHSSIIYTENLVSLHMLKTSLEFNKPIYVGMSILDLSKTLMYDFH
jgi:hypothetical protein